MSAPLKLTQLEIDRSEYTSLERALLKLYYLRGDSFDESQESKKIPDNGLKWHEIRFWRRLRADPGESSSEAI